MPASIGHKLWAATAATNHRCYDGMYVHAQPSVRNVALGDNCEGEGSKADPTVSKSPVHEPLWHTSQPSIAISAQMLFICFDARCGPPFGSSAVRSTPIAIRTMASA